MVGSGKCARHRHAARVTRIECLPSSPTCRTRVSLLLLIVTFLLTTVVGYFAVGGAILGYWELTGVHDQGWWRCDGGWPGHRAGRCAHHWRARKPRRPGRCSQNVSAHSHHQPLASQGATRVLFAVAGLVAGVVAGAVVASALQTASEALHLRHSAGILAIRARPRNLHAAVRRDRLRRLPQSQRARNTPERAGTNLVDALISVLWTRREWRVFRDVGRQGVDVRADANNLGSAVEHRKPVPPPNRKSEAATRTRSVGAIVRPLIWMDVRSMCSPAGAQTIVIREPVRHLQHGRRADTRIVELLLEQPPDLLAAQRHHRHDVAKGLHRR